MAAVLDLDPDRGGLGGDPHADPGAGVHDGVGHQLGDDQLGHVTQVRGTGRPERLPHRTPRSPRGQGLREEGDVDGRCSGQPHPTPLRSPLRWGHDSTIGARAAQEQRCAPARHAGRGLWRTSTALGIGRLSWCRRSHPCAPDRPRPGAARTEDTWRQRSAHSTQSGTVRCSPVSLLLGVMVTVDVQLGRQINGAYAGAAVLTAINADARRTAGVVALTLVASIGLGRVAPQPRRPRLDHPLRHLRAHLRPGPDGRRGQRPAAPAPDADHHAGPARARRPGGRAHRRTHRQAGRRRVPRPRHGHPGRHLGDGALARRRRRAADPHLVRTHQRRRGPVPGDPARQRPAGRGRGAGASRPALPVGEGDHRHLSRPGRLLPERPEPPPPPAAPRRDDVRTAGAHVPARPLHRARGRVPPLPRRRPHQRGRACGRAPGLRRGHAAHGPAGRGVDEPLAQPRHGHHRRGGRSTPRPPLRRLVRAAGAARRRARDGGRPAP